MQESVRKNVNQQIKNKVLPLPAELTNFFKKIRAKNPNIRFGIHGSFVTDTIFKECLGRKDLIPADIDVFVFPDFHTFKKLLDESGVEYSEFFGLSITVKLENGKEFEITFPNEENFSEGRDFTLSSIGFELNEKNEVTKIFNETYLDNFSISQPVKSVDEIFGQKEPNLFLKRNQEKRIARLLKMKAKYDSYGKNKIEFDEKTEREAERIICEVFLSGKKADGVGFIPLNFFTGHQRLNCFYDAKKIKIDDERNFINVIFPFEPNQEKIRKFMAYTLLANDNNCYKNMAYFLWPYLKDSGGDFDAFEQKYLQMWSSVVCRNLKQTFVDIVKEERLITACWDKSQREEPVKKSEPQKTTPVAEPVAFDKSERKHRKPKKWKRPERKFNNASEPKPPKVVRPAISVPVVSKPKEKMPRVVFVPAQAATPVAPAAFFQPPPRRKPRKVAKKPTPEVPVEKSTNISVLRNAFLSFVSTAATAIMFNAAAKAEGIELPIGPNFLLIESALIFMGLCLIELKYPEDTSPAPENRLTKK